jgi:hypothetical protein
MTHLGSPSFALQNVRHDVLRKLIRAHGLTTRNIFYDSKYDEWLITVAVLGGNGDMVEFTEPVAGYPSDVLAMQIMLVAG